MQNEIIFSSSQGRKVWNTLDSIAHNYDQEKNPIELENIAHDLLKKIIDDSMLKKIQEIANNEMSSHIIIRNFLAIQSLPYTPTDDCSPDSVSWRTPASALLGLLRLTGHSARSFMDEMNGRLCHMVMPARNNEKSFLRSTKKLGFHTEVVNGYFYEESPCIGKPVSPEVFGLLGLRNPDGIATTLIPLERVLKSLTPDVISALMKPNFCAISQSSFDREIIIKDVPVLKKLHGGGMGLRYSRSKVMANNTEASEALHQLTDAINHSEHIEQVVLNPGDALILNNRTCVHGRGSITGTQKFDGMDRWLIRIYGYKFATLPMLKTLPEKKHVIMVDI
ncbi:carbon starvation induced protein CsiD [Citrobacter sp. JGM124]|uniref:TauD/TfdA family dioxygenase n=1 Tax=Citrobacter sp. JGM124 TaxID=2799789 RepID=UPI001BA7CBE4|nr:carbon starvation induced protein CsiD [Citrobacter sp. JGM124]MBS0849992.1 TauD/TfdA family dioxygenase [Citrobacter sp. JGM124]